MEQYDARKRAWQSAANAASPEAAASPASVAAFRPRLRIVSIMPGIDRGAPDRTLTSSGSIADPKPRPTFRSSAAICARSSSVSPAGQPLAR